MKKIIFTISFILICYFGWGQSNPYPINQNLGGPTTAVKTPPSGAVYGGLIPYTFADTSAANTSLTYGKTYNGFLIYSTADNALFWRDATNLKWVQVLPSGTPTGLGAWTTTLNTAIPTDISLNGYFGTTASNGIGIYTSNTQRLIMPATGLSLLSSVSDTTSNKVMTFNPSTKIWGYSNWYGGGSGSAGWSLTGNLGTTAGTNFVGTTDNTDLVFKRNSVEGLRLKSGYSNTVFPLLFNANMSGYGPSTGMSIGGEDEDLYLMPVTNTRHSINFGLLSTTGRTWQLPDKNGIFAMTSDIPSVAGSNTQVQFNNSGSFGASASMTFVSPALTIGASGSTTGQLKLTGSTSGIITIQSQAAAGTFNFNLPTTAGTSGYLLTSAGGGSSPMTWTDPSSLGFANTALSNLASVAINTSLLPGTDNSIDLGSGSNQWRYGIFGTGGISIGAAAAPSIGRLQVETGGGANGGITLRNTTAGAYSTMDFYNNGGFNGQFLFTGSTYTNGFFNGNQLAFANYASGGNVGFVAGTASGYIKFGAGALTAAAEKMRINSTGVGIANSSPVALLTLGTAGTTLGSFSSAGNTSGVISFLPQAAAGTYNWNWPTTAGTIGYFLTSGGGGSTAMTWTDPATITGLNYWSTNSGTTLGADVTVTGSGSFNFNISTGATGISTDFGTGKTLLGDVNGAGSGTLITVDDGNLNIILHRSVQFDSYTAGAATFDGSGNITSVSDRRAKHSISPFTYGLNSILKLNPSSYIYNQDKSNTLMSGFIAQDVQKSIPIAVHENGAGMMSLETNAILAANVNAIKELYSMIVKQQTEIDNLKKEINKLKRN